MNLIDATVVESPQGKALHVDDEWQLPVPKRFADRVEAGRDVVVGLRADDIAPQGHGIPPGEKSAFESTVNISEPLGSETLLFVNFGPHEAIAKMIRPRPVREGEAMTFDVNLEELKLFDRTTGEAIRG